MKRYQILQRQLKKIAALQTHFLFFRQKPYEDLATYLAKDICPTMSAKDLENFIATLENIRIKEGSMELTLGDWLATQSLPSLKKIQQRSGFITEEDYQDAIAHGKAMIKVYQANSFSLSDDENFLKDIVAIHGDFLGILERVLYSANTMDFQGQDKYHYSPADLTSSQILKDVEVTTQQPVLPNQGNLSLDAMRRGVSINNQPFTVSTEEEAKKAVEELTKEKVSTLGSKAYAIYHFVSQYLHAVLVNEFAATTSLQGRKITIGSTSGLLNIRNTPEGEWFVDVNTFMYSIMVEDKQGNNKIYIADTEGTSLAEISLDTSLGEEILRKQLPDRRLPHVRVPIGNISGTFKISSNEKNHHYLKAENLTIRYNVEESQTVHQLTLQSGPTPR